MAVSEVMWLSLAWLSVADAGHFLDASVLSEVCGSEDLSLSPSNDCFFRLFGMVQVWDECETHEDAGSCLASCLTGDYCDTLCQGQAACQPQCRKLVLCMQEASGAGGADARSCFEGKPQSAAEHSALEDWFSLAGLGASSELEDSDILVAGAAPAPAPAPITAASPWAAPAQDPVLMAPAGPPAAPAPILPAPSPAFVAAPSPAAEPVQPRVEELPTTTVSTTATVPVATAASAPPPAAPANPATKESQSPAHRTANPTSSTSSARSACLCSLDGEVQGVRTGHMGCAAHGREEVPEGRHYCFVESGSCTKQSFQSRPSKEFPGLYFRECSALDNVLMLFPPSCQAVQRSSPQLRSTKQALSKLRALHNATGVEGRGAVEVSSAMMKVRRLTRALDDLKGDSTFKDRPAAGGRSATLSLPRTSHTEKEDSWLSGWFGFQGGSLIEEHGRRSRFRQKSLTPT